MLNRLNHIALVVPNLSAAITTYQETLKAEVSPPFVEEEHGVRGAFIALENTKIELLDPLDERSPLCGFLKRTPGGGIHHICYEVSDILAARDHLLSQGARVLGDGTPKKGAHGKPVLFLHPQDFFGTLIELEEV